MGKDRIISALIGPVGACNNNFGILSEAEKTEYDIKSGGMQNDQEDYKN